MLIAGLDEAGRGPVIGSIVFGCVVYAEENVAKLEEMGVTDSKKLTPNRREELVDQIKRYAAAWLVKDVSAADINLIHDKGINLNQLEEMQFAAVLNSINPKPEKIYIDSCDVNEVRFGNVILNKLQFQPKEMISKHKADMLFKVVGAASILAKTTRDHIIEGFKAEYGEIGSGYPSDPYTKKFLDAFYQKNRTFPPIVRTWWDTAKNIIKKYDSSNPIQKKLTDF
jgi:ribonuclease HII